jgi:CRISPR-associated protein Csb2
MSITISIRFLTGRAHLHPWQTHHSEGRVEWPPSPWRLLRSIVAVTGRGLTTLPYPDFVFEPIDQLAKSERRGKKTLESVGAPQVDYWQDQKDDCVKINRLSKLLAALSATPATWLPKTSGGHTRQYFPIHEGGLVKNTGSAVFDTFATVRKDQPLLFHWSDVNLDAQQLGDLKLILGRMTYFGRAESWCRVEAHTCLPEEINVDGISQIVLGKTHWECVCIEDHGQPVDKKEYRDYLLERRLAPVKELKTEAVGLLPRTKTSDGKDRKKGSEAFKSALESESEEKLLLRCLLRESGQDIKDGLERPIGTRWIHYAVPRVIYDVPRPKPQSRQRTKESVDLVRYTLNTATASRPVLPAMTDTLLVADRFRSAIMALCREPGHSVSGHEEDGSPCMDHQHAFWWPLDEDNDGFIDHVMVWAPGGFEGREIDALRRLTRLRQRGGRPDLLVTPLFVGQEVNYRPWRVAPDTDGTSAFVSATPYFCPVHLSHGRRSSGRTRSLKREIIRGLIIQGIVETEDAVSRVDEIVFDFAPEELVGVTQAVANHATTEPVPPRQYFPVIETPNDYPLLPKPSAITDNRYRGAVLKDADEGYCFGAAQGLLVGRGNRFVRALSFCRRRRGHELRENGRMLQITFSRPRPPRPFAIGNQCHFGLGLFAPVESS